MTTEEAKQRLASRIQNLALDDDDLLALQTLIPELSESEDERIRKEIINYLSNELHNVKQLTPRTNEFEAWIAYLERQKETKPIQPNIEREYIEERLRGLLDKEGEYYRGVREELAHLFYILGGEPSQYLINNVAKEEQKPAEWSVEDKEMLKITLDNLEELAQRYGENYGRVGKCIEWIESLPERFNLQPKQECGEEDEKKVSLLVENKPNAFPIVNVDTNYMDCDECDF